jgi:hypothetical protein
LTWLLRWSLKRLFGLLILSASEVAVACFKNKKEKSNPT